MPTDIMMFLISFLPISPDQYRQPSPIEILPYYFFYIHILPHIGMQEEFEVIDVVDFGKKDKKEKKAKEGATKKAKVEVAQVEAPVKVVDHEKRYIQLLKRATELLNKNNPELAEKSKIVLKPPQSTRVGSKKTAIINFAELCKQLDRHPQHVMNFFINQLGREGSMGNQGFTIKIVIQQKQIENLFRKYITEYVQCQICKRQNTELVKDEKMRLWTLVCRDCKCKRTVPTIKGSEKKYEDYEKELAEREEKGGPE